MNFLTILIIFLTPYLSWSKSATSVAIIDMPKTLQSTTEGKKIKQDIEKDFRKTKAELATEEKALKVKAEELQKKKDILSEDAFQQKQNEIQKEIAQFTEKVQTKQGELQKRQQESMAPLLQKIQTSIRKLAQEKEIDLVIEKTNGVFWNTPQMDITELIIKMTSEKI